MDSPNLLQLLREKAEAVQVVVQEITDLAEACRYAVEVTSRQGGATIAAPGWDPATLSLLKDICQAAQIEVLTENLREQASRLHTGLTLADWGLAETGTLVHESSSEDLRLATMLSETHIAVLPLSRLQPDATALEAELNGLMHSPPRYLAFITGASRTADIERVLTLGVHGPLELHLLLLKD
ncbi:MAG: LUD domain-containing protein [Deltaproteobacteria bacterium]|nr:LUD domain-containing protein [Deltaproteobacteria bacterium]MBI4796980.1 LUD domain-containing protein [Deltaproteobacteria bacterium]